MRPEVEIALIGLVSVVITAAQTIVLELVRRRATREARSEIREAISTVRSDRPPDSQSGIVTPREGHKR